MARNSVAYDEDFYAWTTEQARLLRQGELSLIDAENIAEELESVGRSDRRELASRLEVLLSHLLKWQVQVGFRSSSWSRTIKEQRRRIERLLRESPSLRSALDELVAESYGEAREQAVSETGLAEDAFPAACPFSPEQILAAGFLPER
jgi:hypothetical protein